MAILHSDSFNGMSLDDPLWSSRNLDNALGGSGTLAWNSVSGAYIGSDGANRIYYREATGGRALVGLGSSADRLVRARVRFSAAASAAILGRTTAYDGSDFTGVRVSIGSSLDSMTTLKIQTVDSGGTGTDRASTTVTALSTSTDYWLALKVVGSVVTAYLYAADGTSTVGAVLGTCTYTLGSALTGAYWGLRFLADSDPSVKFDDWIEEDAPAAAATRCPVVVIM